MAKIINIYDRHYVIGRVKNSSDFGIWENKGKSWKLIFQNSDKENISKRFLHLRKLAEKREYRHLVSDMCGTPYKEAVEDMGLKRI